MLTVPIAAFRRLFAEPSEADAVHFHSGPQSEPAVCYDAHCRNPRLDVE